MKRLTCCVFVALSLLFSASSLVAQSIWNVTNGNWNATASWNPAALPVSSPTLHLRFNATGAYTSTNNLGPITLNRLTINNTSNGTLTLASSATANMLTFAGDNPTLDITGTARFTGLFGGSATITKTGTGTFIHDSDNANFTGTIIINQGRFSNWGGATSTATLVNNFNPAAIIVNDGGVYQFGNTGIGDPNLPLTTYITVNNGGLVSWQEPQIFGGFHLDGGSIDLLYGNATANGTTAQIWTGGTVGGNATTGTAYVVNGSAPIHKTTSGTLILTGAAAISNTGGLHIKEGTVVLSNATNLGTAPITFGSTDLTGTLEYRGATASRAGNIIRSADGYGDIRITQPSTILTLSGANTGMGMLTKSGAGTLYLTGSLSATGLTYVAEGTLRVNSASASGSFAVDPGATLAVNAASGTTEFNVPMLMMSEGSTLQLDLNTNTVPTKALVSIRSEGGLSLADNTTIHVTNARPFANGLYTLIDYESSWAYEWGINLKIAGRTLGHLIYDTTNTRIQMQVTGTDSVKWTGATNGIWDRGTEADVGGTKNWQLVTGGTATNFIDSDSIVFDDTALGYNVQLDGTLKPYSLSVNANSDYTFTGEGKISGTTSLIKSGSGTLILATDNDYSGGTTVSSGALQLGDGGTRGNITGGLNLNNGTLIFNRSDAFVFDNIVTITGNTTIRQNGSATTTMNSRLALGATTLTFDGTGVLDMVGGITGTGVINKNGSGHVNLLGASSFNGILNINGGTVQLTDRGASGDINAVSIVVNNTATFIFGPEGNPDLPSNTIVTINAGGLFQIGTGESYGGFILNGGEYRAVGAVGSTGEATAVGNVVYDLRSGKLGTSITGTGNANLGQSGGGVLAKTTSGTVTVERGTTFSANMSLQVREGTLSLPTTAVPATGTAVVTGNTTLASLDFGTATTEGTLEIYGTGSATTSRVVNVAAGGGRIHLPDSGVNLTLNGAIAGQGGLIKSGAGTLNINGALNSTGTTTVEEGLLRLKPGTAAGALSVKTGSTLAVRNDALVSTLNVPALMMASGSTLLFELNTATLPGVPLINISGSNGLAGNQDVLIRLTNTQHFATGVYTLLDYAGTTITSGFNLQVEGRATATLIYDTANTKINASITQGEEVRWTGAQSNVWDVGSAVNVGGSQNWLTTTSLNATNFVQTDFVHFDDTASQYHVALNAEVRPNRITVNSARDYLFNGTGKITGGTALQKSGPGVLILATDNDYAGGTIVSGGALQLGDAGDRGSITGSLTLNGGNLIFNRNTPLSFTSAVTISANTEIMQNGSGAITMSSALVLGANILTINGGGNLTLSGVISGTAAEPIVMNGSGILYLPATNTFTGTTVINSGIVSVSTNRGLGLATAGVYINGGTLQLTASNFGTVSSTGRKITVGPNGAVFDFRTNQNFQGNGFFGTGTVVKTGAGEWSVGANGSTFSGEIFIREGSLMMTSAQLNFAKNMTIEDGGQLAINDDAPGTWSLAANGKYTFYGDGGGTGALRQYNGSTGTAANNTFTTTFNRELSLQGERVLVNTVAERGTLLVTSAVTGPAMLNKIGPGTLTFSNNNNSYSGGTLIQSGTLLVTNTTGSATGTGAVTIGDTAKLRGTGRITGETTIKNGGAVQGGNLTTTGKLTFTGALIMESGSSADFRLNGNGNNDSLVFDTLTLESGASFNIILGYTPNEGDTFNLLDWSSLSTFSASTDWSSHLNLSNAILSEGLKWDTTLFNSDGILAVVVVPEPSRLLLLMVAVGGMVLRRRRSHKA